MWIQMCGRECVYECSYVYVQLYAHAQVYSSCECLRPWLCFVLPFSLAYSWLVPTLDPQLDVCTPLLLQATWKSVPRALPWTTSGTGRLSTSPHL